MTLNRFKFYVVTVEASRTSDSSKKIWHDWIWTIEPYLLWFSGMLGLVVWYPNINRTTVIPS